MFISASRVADVGCGLAQQRLTGMLRAGKLPGMSQAAHGAAVAALMRVGPAGGVPGLSKLVQVGFLDPVCRGEVMTVGLRWQAAGVTGALFPVLDADITLAPAGGGATTVTLTGTYRPPLGAVGAGLDRLLLHGAAEATITALLSDVSDALLDPAPAPACGPQPAPWPWPATGQEA